MIPFTTYDDDLAREKGRQMALRALSVDQEHRKNVEEKLGLDFCKRYWPELYAPSPFLKRVFEKFKPLTW
jgi:hypothetical protein